MNECTILEVEAPDLKGTEVQEFATAGVKLPQRSRAGWIEVQNVKQFFIEPLRH